MIHQNKNRPEAVYNRIGGGSFNTYFQSAESFFSGRSRLCPKSGAAGGQKNQQEEN